MKFDIARAWKDESYRANLSEAERSQLPAHPAGELALSDSELESIYGGGGQNGEDNVNGSGICDINVLQTNILNIELLGNLVANCEN